MLAASAALATTPETSDWAEPRFEGRYAVIDASHFELARLDNAHEGIGGLSANLQRNGYVSFVMSEFDEAMLRNADLLIVPAPTAAFDDAEMEAVERFVERGGLLVVTLGAERTLPSHGLFERFGVEPGTTPLGRAEATWARQQVRFWSAWPLEHDPADGYQVVTQVWDYPVMLYREQGDGGVLLVGDSSFLLNKNLEDNDSFEQGNILFLRYFLESVGRGRESDE